MIERNAETDMDIKRFDVKKDFLRLEGYLRARYSETHNMTSWLPERLHDLIYRMDVQYTDCGMKKSADYIFMWEESGDIIGCILPDGDAVYMSIKTGYEDIFPEMLSFAEENCIPLFEKGSDGKRDFLVIANDSLTAGGGATVDGAALADNIVVANLDSSIFTGKFQILRHSSNDGTGEDAAVLANTGAGEDGHIGANPSAVTNLDILVDGGKIGNFNVLANLGIWVKVV